MTQQANDTQNTQDDNLDLAIVWGKDSGVHPYMLEHILEMPQTDRYVDEYIEEAFKVYLIQLSVPNISFGLARQIANGARVVNIEERDEDYMVTFPSKGESQ